MNEYIAENNRIAFVQYTHEDDSDMNTKMGFEIVETVYEYYLEW